MSPSIYDDAMINSFESYLIFNATRSGVYELSKLRAYIVLVFMDGYCRSRLSSSFLPIVRIGC